MSKAILFLYVVITISSCATTEGSRLESEQLRTPCELQLEEIATKDSEARLVERSKQAGGFVLSYGATAAGYTADALVYVTEGIVKTVVYCPAYAFSMALGHLPMRYCNPKHPEDHVKGTRFGKSIYRNTKKMREADFSQLSMAIQHVSECFEKRGSRSDLVKAKEQLVALRDSDIFSTLPDDHKKAIQNTVDRLDNKLRK